MGDVFISTEPLLINYQQYNLSQYSSEYIAQKWQKYWYSKLNHHFTNIYHTPLQHIEYIQYFEQHLQNIQNYTAVFFVSPHAIHSYYASFGMLPSCKEIWLIGRGSYECLMNYYTKDNYTNKLCANIIYIDNEYNSNAKILYEKLLHTSLLFSHKINTNKNYVKYLEKRILVVKQENSNNNYLYDILVKTHQVHIDYAYTYKSTPISIKELKNIDTIADVTNANIFGIYISSSQSINNNLSNILNNVKTKNTQLILYTKHQKILKIAQDLQLFNDYQLIK